MKYVLITGASAGIGKAFAKQLAREGHHLILLARCKDKLLALAEQLTSDNNICVEIIAADLTYPQTCEMVANHVADKGWQLEGLVNNAGFGELGLFDQMPLARQMEMVQLNVNCVVDFSHRLIPALKKNSSAFIINVASTAAFQAGPTMATYFATKAFVLSFSEALHEELKADGITVSALCPGTNQSEFADMQGTGLFKMDAMSADAVVEKSLASRAKAIVIPGLKNLLTVWLGRLAPRSVNRKVVRWIQSRA